MANFLRILPLVFALLAMASAQVPDRPLQVAVREVPPFAMKDSAGNWEGLSVDLWQDVADKTGLRFEWREMALKETLQALETGTVDVAIAALTVTEQRERTMDFSHPYYVGGLALGHTGSRQSAWISTLKGFLSIEFLSAVTSLVVVLLIAGAAVWFFERRGNPDEFSGGARGLGDGFWWSAVTMTTVGYGDKSPKTLGGRVVALIWMFASLIIIAGFTASIASSLTANRLSGGAPGERKLSRLKVAVLEGSNAEEFAYSEGARPQPFPTIAEALAAVKDGSADVVLHDEPLLRHHSRTDADWLEVSNRTLVRDDYGFGLPSSSTLREEINTALLSILHEPVWQSIRERYLGETAEN